MVEKTTTSAPLAQATSRAIRFREVHGILPKRQSQPIPWPSNMLLVCSLGKPSVFSSQEERRGRKKEIIIFEKNFGENLFLVPGQFTFPANENPKPGLFRLRP